MTGFEQLLYTWVGRGPKGNSGFQPIAATGRLSDGRSTLTRAALELCRYEAPRGASAPTQMPVSYGWIDHGSWRIVFRRSYAGKDALGRPGNFHAQIVTGPREALPAMEIARRLTSPFWWAGENAENYAAGDLGLKLADLTDIEPAPLPVADPELLARFTEALLSHRPRLPLVLRCAPGQTAAVLTAVAGRLPGAIETMPFSTYEPPQMAARFQVLGTAGAGAPANATIVSDVPPSARPEPVRRARELILSNEPGDQSLVKMCVATSDQRSGPANVARLGVMINLFDRLRRGAPIDKAAVAAALGRPASAEILLGMPTAVEVIAADLVASQPTLWDCLRSSAGAIPGAVLAGLGTAVGKKAAHHASAALLNRVISTADQLRAEFASACARAAVIEAGSSPDMLKQLAAAPIVSMLRHGKAGRLDPAEPGIAALLAAPNAFPVAADATDLPPSWRGQIFAHLLARSPGATARVADRLNRDPQLAGPLAEALAEQIGRLTAVLSQMDPPYRISCTLQAARSLPADRRYDLADWCADSLAVRDRLRFLTGLAPLIPATTRQVWWDSRAAAAVEGWTADVLQRLDIDPVPPREVLHTLAAAGSARAAFWEKLVAHLSRPGWGGKTDAFDRWLISGIRIIERITTSAPESVPLDLMLFATLRCQISRDQFSTLSERLAEWLRTGSEETAVYLMTAAYRVSLRSGENRAAVLCLMHVADLIDRQTVRITVFGQLRGKLNSLAADLYKRLPDDRVAEVADSISRSCQSKAPAAWWASMGRPLRRYRAVRR